MPTTPAFVHLHQHSEWSLLDGACRVREMPARAAELGMKALAITDHGAMHGVLDFYQACKKAEIKPIIGCEVYVAPRSRFEKEAQVDKDPYHFVLIARDAVGYRNLVKLVSRAQLEGFYYKPRVDRDLLAQHAEGLTALSACLGAEVPQMLLQEKLKEAEEAAAFYRDVYGREHFFLELQDHGIPEQRAVNRHLVEMSRRLQLDLVATNDAHYLRKGDAKAHDILLCIQTAANLDSPKRMRFPTEEFYLKSPEEMAALFAEVPEALTNTAAVAEQCNLQFEFGKYLLPKFPLPEGHTAGSYLRQLCEERLPQRYPNASPDLVRQMTYELDLIEKMGFSAYLLIVWDYCDFARRNGIPVGPGRGSAAGSLVCYLTGITNIDPIRYKLVFERFLNPERVEMPDIDIDFCPERRGDVIEYVAQRYGADCVAQIAAFGTMGARGVIRDVGRTLGFAPVETDKIAKLVPEGVDVSLADALQPGAELAQLVSKETRVKELVEVAKLLEGTPRHVSVHAAGVVIAPEPLEDIVPLMRNKDGRPAIQFDMDQCKKLGLLKMDFLGLRNLTVIDDCRKRVEARGGRALDIDNLPLDDEATFRMISDGHTVGMFQFESSGMTDVVRQVRPNNIEDIIAVSALFRPGPMENIPLYVKSKHGGNPVYPHPDLAPILKDTYGVMIYQEQVQQVAAKMGGFTLGEADMLRRAISKKDMELMEKYKIRFVAGCEQNGYGKDLAEQVYAQIEKFAGYGFNRCVCGDTVVVDASTGARLRVAEIFEQRLRPNVLAVDERGRLVRRRVTDAMANGVKPVLRVHTRSGRNVRCTANHRIMTSDGWREAGALQVGDRVAVPRRIDVGGTERWPHHKLAVLGYVLSESNAAHPASFQYHAKDPLAVADYVAALEQFENTVPLVSLYRGKIAATVRAKRRDPRRPSDAVVWIRALGLGGRAATSQHVPEAAFRLGGEDLALVLAKMWVGDGHIGLRAATRAPEVFYATSSQRLAADVQHLLLRLGVASTVRRRAFKSRGGVEPGFTVAILGDEAVGHFLRLVRPHLVGAKAEAADAVLVHALYGQEQACVLRAGTVDAVPVQVLDPIRSEMHKNGVSAVQVATKAGVSPRNVWDGPSTKAGYPRETLAALAGALGSERWRDEATSDVLWDPVVAVEPDGEDETYDLTVDGLHNFVADDIVVHNSHSAAYGYVTYQTAYLKTNYPVEYMAALLTSTSGGKTNKKDSAALYIAEARRLGIAVLPPDVNDSRADFTDLVDAGASPEHPGTIRVGLGAVKNVGSTAVDSIIAARQEGGTFKSLTDFCRRVDLKVCNKRSIESLIKAGAFDSLGLGRARLLAGLEDCMKAAQARAKEMARGQRSLLDLLGGGPGEADGAGPVTDGLPDVPEFDKKDLLAQEKEVLGLYISGHPLESLTEELRMRTHSVQSLQDKLDGDRCTVGGIVTALRRTATKKGDPMAFVTLEDLTGQTEVVVFPKLYAQVDKDLIQPDCIVLLRGKVSWRGERRGGDAEGPEAGESADSGEVTVVADEVESFLEGPTAAAAAAMAGSAFLTGNGTFPPPTSYTDPEPPADAELPPPSAEPERVRAQGETAAAAEAPRTVKHYVVRVPTAGDELGLNLLAAALRAHPGTMPVEIHFEAEGRGLLAGPTYRVDGSPALAADIAAIPFAPAQEEAALAR